MIALVGLNAQVYGDGGRLVLFGFTLVILLLVVIVLLCWINYLSVLGRTGETIRRVETATFKAMMQRLKKPYLGPSAARRRVRAARGVCARNRLCADVSMDLLQACTEENDDMLHLHVLPGAFVEPSVVMVSSHRPVDEARRRAICNAVSIGPSRTFDHDPRFGLV